MLEDIWAWFYCKPRRLYLLGKTILLLGFGQFMFGALGLVAVAGSHIPWLTMSASSSKTLSEIYPTLPTWWIPESAFSFIMAAALAGIGFLIAMDGKKYMKIIGDND